MKATLLLWAAGAVALNAAPLSFDADIKPIFREHCLKCHGDDEQKADLNLQNFDTLMAGGSGGKTVVAGRASQSLLFQAITDPDDDARMPPNKPMIPAEQIETIRVWIQEGVRQRADSKSMVAERDLNFAPTGNAGAKPEGAPPMPENLPAVKLAEPARALPILAMDTSPWAPLLAVSGYEQVRLIHTETQATLGVLPFPEGVPHVIRFSRDGAVLMVAGGKPVESGKVVLFDVKTGKRLAEAGDEIDAVLAADVSPDLRQIALGGSGKVVKVYDTAKGTLLYKLTKHTDWITSIGFSPDGAKLATADRAGGLHLWDAKGGGILLTLAEHKASVRAVSWRGDSKLLASAGEDGLLIWWDVADGWPAVSNPNAHPPARPAGSYGKLPNGVLAASFGPNGELLTAGRDRVVRYWNPGGGYLKHFGVPEAMPTATRISGDGKVLISGDAAGKLHYWNMK